MGHSSSDNTACLLLFFHPLYGIASGCFNVGRLSEYKEPFTGRLSTPQAGPCLVCSDLDRFYKGNQCSIFGLFSGLENPDLLLAKSGSTPAHEAPYPATVG